MSRAVLCMFLIAAGCAAALGAPSEPACYKPGDWVEVPASGPGLLAAPGTTTVMEPVHGEAQYALPMTEPWTAVFNGAILEVNAVAERGWLAASLERGAGGILSGAESGILKALPPGSKLVPLGDVRRGVPESVDLIVSYDFSERMLQPQELGAIKEFVRRGGAVCFLFASQIPAASVEFWRDLFGAGGEARMQAPGLPHGVRVPPGFALRFEQDMPELVWRQSGRGVVLAYRLSPNEDLLKDAEATARVFGRVVQYVRENRRPLRLGPAEPEAFRLFDPPEWAAGPRRRSALLAVGYAAGAAGLLVSFGSLLARRRWMWLPGLAFIAVGGAAVVYGSVEGKSGLALDTASVMIIEPGADPAVVVLGRIARLGPGGDPQLPSYAVMPPKLLVYARYSAEQKNWVNYRFMPGHATVQPVLGIGQSLCLGSISLMPASSAAGLGAMHEVAAPAHGDDLIRFFEKRWAQKGTSYRFRWVARDANAPALPPVAAGRLFDWTADRHFVQMNYYPMLVIEGSAE